MSKARKAKIAATKDGAASDPVDALVARLLAGDRYALSRAITALECDDAKAGRILQALQPHLGHCSVVGFTGPPGAGKSTLVNAFITAVRRRGRSVGVIAVDPSSPISGGAILGDRLRMTDQLSDDGVFVRSLASRGHLGGLSPAALRIVDALDAAGKDLVLIETVGTGQSEVEVAQVADAKVVVLAPGLGDDIQAMKAGILEIADVVVVNKADLPKADVTLEQLKSAFALRTSAARNLPVLKTVALTGEGVEALVDAVEAYSGAGAKSDRQARRRARLRRALAQTAAQLLRRHAEESEDPAVLALCDAVGRGELDLASAARRLLKGSAEELD